MRKLLIVTFVLSAFISARGQTGAGKKMELQSPDKRLKMNMELGKNTLYAVQFKGKPVILPSEISMTLDKMELGKAVQIKNTKTNKKTGFNELVISATG